MAFKIRDGCSFRPFNSAAKNTLTRRKPPQRHLAVMMKGGLVELYDRINRNLVEVKYETGTYTNTKDGVLVPDVDMPLLASRYKFVKILGKGQSSILFKAQDVFNKGSYVAIKALHVHYHMLGAQETECIRRLNAADPMCYSPTLRIKTVFDFDKHYCMVFELLSAKSIVDIFDRMTRKEAISNIRVVAKTVLTALGFLQQQNVIHADLKPENILLQHDNDLRSLKVVDFGNAIHCVHEELSLYYDDYELQTLLYRAPEVMFGCSFGLEIDMWSLGCILAELYHGKPIFSGRDKLEVIQKIVNLLGPVPEDLVADGKFYSQLKQFSSKSARPTTVIEMKKHFRDCNDYTFIDFIMRLLKYRPNERMTVMEAACHPFLASELGTAYLFNVSNKLSGYPQVFLDETSYKKKPIINIDVPHQKMSSIDFLRYGTGNQYQNSTVNGRYNHSNSNNHRSSNKNSIRSKHNEHAHKNIQNNFRNGLHSPSLFPSSNGFSHDMINRCLSVSNKENPATSLHNLFGKSSYVDSNHFSTNTPWLESLNGKTFMNVAPESLYQNPTLFSNGLFHNEFLRDSFAKHYESLNVIDKQIPIVIGLNKINELNNNNIDNSTSNNKSLHKLFTNETKPSYIPSVPYSFNNLNFAKSQNDAKQILNGNINYASLIEKDRKMYPFLDSLIDVHSSGIVSNALNCIDRKCFPSVKCEPVSSLSTSLFKEFREKSRSHEKALNVSTVSSTVSESKYENYNDLARKIKVEPDDSNSTSYVDSKLDNSATVYRKFDKSKRKESYPYTTKKHNINQSANVSSSSNDIDIEYNKQSKKYSSHAYGIDQKVDMLKPITYSKNKSATNGLYNQYSECTSNGFDHNDLTKSLSIKSALNAKDQVYQDSSNSLPSNDNHSASFSHSPAFSDSIGLSPNNANYCDTISSKDNVFPLIDSSAKGPYRNFESNIDSDCSSNLKHQKKRKIVSKKDTDQVSLRRTSRKVNPCNYTILSDDDMYSSDDSYSPAKYSKKSCKKKRLKDSNRYDFDSNGCSPIENNSMTLHNNAKKMLVLNW